MVITARAGGDTTLDEDGQPNSRDGDLAAAYDWLAQVYQCGSYWMMLRAGEGVALASRWEAAADRMDAGGAK